jgi:hypothetical protein
MSAWAFTRLIANTFQGSSSLFKRTLVHERQGHDVALRSPRTLSGSTTSARWNPSRSRSSAHARVAQPMKAPANVWRPDRSPTQSSSSCLPCVRSACLAETKKAGAFLHRPLGLRMRNSDQKKL